MKYYITNMKPTFIIEQNCAFSATSNVSHLTVFKQTNKYFRHLTLRQFQRPQNTIESNVLQQGNYLSKYPCQCVSLEVWSRISLYQQTIPQLLPMRLHFLCPMWLCFSFGEPHDNYFLQVSHGYYLWQKHNTVYLLLYSNNVCIQLSQ